MSVDIVIALYNGSKWIGETLESVFNQSLKANRIIVVDDGSTDDSLRVVSKYSSIMVLRNPGKGPCSARNFGFQHTSAPCVVFLDQDDIWHQDHLKILLEVLKRYPEVPAVAAYHTSLYGNNRPVFDLRDLSTEFIEPWKIYPVLRLSCNPSATIFRREAFGEVGWSEEFTGMADYFLWMKLSVRSPLVRIRAKTVAYRIHQDSQYMKLLENPLEYVQLWQRAADDLLQSRLNSSGSKNEEVLLKKRNLIVHKIYNLLLNINNKDWDAFRESALELDDVLKDESVDFVKLFLNMIINFLSKKLFHEWRTSLKQNYYKIVLDLWPVKASITKKILLNVIVENRPGVSFYLDYYWNRPVQFIRLVLFFIAARRNILTSQV